MQDHQNPPSPEEIAEKLAQFNAIYAVCNQRCIDGCDPEVRAAYMPLRIWFAERNLPLKLDGDHYIIEQDQQD